MNAASCPDMMEGESRAPISRCTMNQSMPLCEDSEIAMFEANPCKN